jgi:hypothetical protein
MSTVIEYGGLNAMDEGTDKIAEGNIVGGVVQTTVGFFSMAPVPGLGMADDAARGAEALSHADDAVRGAEQLGGHVDDAAHAAKLAPDAAQPASSVRSSARGGESPAAARGRQAHRDWDPGAGFEKEVTLPSGRRADAINPTTRTVRELKPNNPRAIRRGQRQVERYRRELEERTGEKWTGEVHTYDP